MARGAAEERGEGRSDSPAEERAEKKGKGLKFMHKKRGKR